MHFEDLSPYTYDDGQATMLNVGWLAKDKPFPHGTAVGWAFVSNLRALIKRPENLCRGYHCCDLCDQPEWSKARSDGFDVWAATRQGNGEVHVESNGVVYAAPVLVLHYVTEHGYSPPPEFVKAVSSMDYLELRKANAKAESDNVESNLQASRRSGGR